MNALRPRLTAFPCGRHERPNEKKPAQANLGGLLHFDVVAT